MGKHVEQKCICGTLACIFLCVFLIAGILPLMKYNEYEEYSCEVMDVRYPTELPIIDNATNWAECDCGRSCKSWSTCIDIDVGIINPNYSSNKYINNKIYTAKDNIESIHDKCTFHNSKCKNGENIFELNESLLEAQKTFNKYNNNTIECFYDKNRDIVLINNNYDYIILIVMGSLTLFVCICFACTFNCKCEKKNSSTSQIV